MVQQITPEGRPEQIGETNQRRKTAGGGDRLLQGQAAVDPGLPSPQREERVDDHQVTARDECLGTSNEQARILPRLPGTLCEQCQQALTLTRRARLACLQAPGHDNRGDDRQHRPGPICQSTRCQRVITHAAEESRQLRKEQDHRDCAEAIADAGSREKFAARSVARVVGKHDRHHAGHARRADAEEHPAQDELCQVLDQREQHERRPDPCEAQ